VTAKKNASARKADAIAHVRVNPPGMGVPSHDSTALMVGAD
jgi:hypothetical protein